MKLVSWVKATLSDPARLLIHENDVDNKVEYAILLTCESISYSGFDKLPGLRGYEVPENKLPILMNKLAKEGFRLVSNPVKVMQQHKRKSAFDDEIK